MAAFDGGLKYHGYSLEGEYFLRWLDHFEGPGTAGLASIFSHGFQMQASAMVVPKTLQFYLGQSNHLRQVWKSVGFSGGSELLSVPQQSHPLEQ